MSKKLWAAVLALGLAGATAALPLGAQTAGGGGGGGRMTPQQWQQRMADRIKERLGCTDEEWKILQPKIEKVGEARRATMGGMGFGRGGRGGPGGGGADAATSRPSTPVQEKTADLQKALDDKNTSSEVIKAKLTALREARAKAREELTKAQADLKELVTVRQEAVLVEMGLLE